LQKRPSGLFEREFFDFFGRNLGGAKEMRARWKRCTDQVDNQLPDALGRMFVEKTLGDEGKRRTQQMVAALEKALERDIKSLDWMTDKTKEQALIKLRAIINKVGSKANWMDYTPVEVARSDAYGNAARTSLFELRRQLAKIGKPLDKTDWSMSQPTVNAYYDPQENDINFPAGILQPPFYDNKMDDAVNFGAIGAVIGHELTHGFDDQGRQFDAQGNLRDWWTEEDAKAFEKRAQCFVDQYAGFTAVDNVKLNGKLTLGENTADNGGLRIAYMALMDTLAGKTPPKRDGFGAEQRLFLGWAQVWCTNQSDENARTQAQSNEHSTGQFRVNGVVQNMPEFRKAFACKAGQPMVKSPACRVVSPPSASPRSRAICSGVRLPNQSRKAMDNSGSRDFVQQSHPWSKPVLPRRNPRPSSTVSTGRTVAANPSARPPSSAKPPVNEHWRSA
jgi:endothelin-converting enzyme/putative endopeptidase